MPTLDLASIHPGIHPGLTASASLVVGPEHTAPRIGSGRIAVLATPVMINLMEAAALAAAEGLLPAGHQSLGIRLDIRHYAATPVGLRVIATAELVGISGRTLEFRVDARDEKEAIGDGLHPRVVVTLARFAEGRQSKVRGARSASSRSGRLTLRRSGRSSPPFRSTSAPTSPTSSPAPRSAAPTRPCWCAPRLS